MTQKYARRLTTIFIGFALIVLAAGVAAGQAPTPPAPAPTLAAKPPANPPAAKPEPPDKVVLKVGDQQFTKADLDNLIARLDPRSQSVLAAKGKKPLGDWYTTLIILAQRAHAHHLDENPDFIQNLAFEKEKMEAQAASLEIERETKVAPEDIQKYYNEHLADYDQITVRQIVVRVKPPAPPNPPANSVPSTAPGLSPEEAKTRAEAIRKEIMAGTEIKKVSEDFKAPGVVIIEPDTRVTRRSAMRPDLAKVAFDLKDGEVSEPIDSPPWVLMYQVTAHSHVDLKSATPDIEKTLRPQKFEAAIAEVKKSTPVWMDAQYFEAPPGAPEAPHLSTPGTTTPAKP